MARLFEFIFFATVAYFVFKFLNRLFNTPSSTTTDTKTQPFKNQKQSPSLKQEINWDAETIDYEEVETKDDEKK